MENAICVVCRHVPEESFEEVWQDHCPSCVYNLGDCWAVLDEFLSAVEVCFDCYDVIATRDECGIVHGAESSFSKDACPRCFGWDDEAQASKERGVIGGDRFKVYESAFEDANWDYVVEATSTGADGHAVRAVVPFAGQERFANKGDASTTLMMNLELLKSAGFFDFKVTQVVASDLEFLEVG